MRPIDASLFSAILPDSAVAIDAPGWLADARLWPEEALSLGTVAATRHREFSVARTCARRAMQALGVPAVPILIGRDREPLWPEEIVGSITHCTGLCAAAVARRGDLLAIGIDAEPRGTLPEGILDMIASEAERAWIHTQRGDGVDWDRLLFSAKESVFKAWFFLTHRWLGFKDAVVSFDGDSNAFDARLLVEGPCVGGATLHAFAGRYALCSEHLVTAVSVTADPVDIGERTAA